MISSVGSSLSRLEAANLTSTLTYGHWRYTYVRWEVVDSPPSVVNTFIKSARVIPVLTVCVAFNTSAIHAVCCVSICEGFGLSRKNAEARIRARTRRLRDAFGKIERLADAILSALEAPDFDTAKNLLRTVVEKELPKPSPIPRFAPA